MREERLRKTEQLLREAASWEPEGSAPERLAQCALAVALQQERRHRRRVSGFSMFLAVLCGGGAISAALSGALLMVGVPSHPRVPAPAEAPLARSPQKAPDSVPARPVSEVRPTLAAAMQARPRAPKRGFRRYRSGAGLVSRVAASRQSLPRAIWRTEEVERRKEGVIAPAVLVAPDPDTGSVYVAPTLVDISLPPGSSACGPAEETAPASEPEPAGAPEGPQDQDGGRG